MLDRAQRGCASHGAGPKKQPMRDHGTPKFFYVGLRCVLSIPYPSFSSLGSLGRILIFCAATHQRRGPLNDLSDCRDNGRFHFTTDYTIRLSAWRAPALMIIQSVPLAVTDWGIDSLWVEHSRCPSCLDLPYGVTCVAIGRPSGY